MKKRNIRKVAVLGSGIMGSRIACHFANIGIEVLLLDIVPRELNEKEKATGLTLADRPVRNRIVNEAFTSTISATPAALYNKKFVNRISLGNFEDDMTKIKYFDWVIEVVVENPYIKKTVFERVEKYRKPGTLITSNTSGIPIRLMLEGRSEDFQKNFCGTHFFNPPRYLKLLEIIPTSQTDREVIKFLMHYGDRYLGKTTVLCKDTPAFIANRVGIFAILKIVDSMKKLSMNIDEIDKLTGAVIGRPKSATFRTSDIVGIDTLAKVTDNLYDGLPDDEEREMFTLPDVINTLVEKNWLGDKTSQGFYKKTTDEKGKRQILTLDLETLKYKPKTKVKFGTLEATKPVENIRERFKMLLSGKDKAGIFYRDSFYALFQYVSHRIAEIADELYKIDDAVCAGFGWEVGPFETWDLVNAKKTVAKMEEAGCKPNQWVYDMFDSGKGSFYKVENGVRMYYDISTSTYKAIPGLDDFIILDNIRKSSAVWSNSGATIFDLGDGVLNIEFHTKMNTLGGEVLEGLDKAIVMAEESYRGLVVGNQGAQFSAGANLGVLFMYAVEQEYDEIELMVRRFQNSVMRIRYSSVPVVVAPHGLTLGGGCEMTMHADMVQAAAETYIGLVEVGVGLIPAAGGTKEFARRVADMYQRGDIAFNDLQNAFTNIATAKVSTSAEEARDMHILRPRDRISVSTRRQIADGKAAAIELATAGYVQKAQRSNIKVHGKAAKAMFLAGVNNMRTGHYISDHDLKIAGKIAHVICGGDLSYPQEVTEQYLLDLEREAFLSLCAEKKTLERIQSILTKGKPLRN